MLLSDYKGFVSTLATIVTIIQFLSGIDICKKVRQQGSTGDVSGLPFIVGIFSTGLWLIYSLMLNDFPMKITNFVGFTLQVVYLMIYFSYCISLNAWKVLRRQMLFFGFLFGCISYYIFYSGQSSDTISYTIGLLCCAGSIIFCLSPLASLREVFLTKSTAILPFPLILSMAFVGGLWCLYGIIIDNSFIIYPNFFVFIIATFQLLLFLVYPSKSKGSLISNN